MKKLSVMGILAVGLASLLSTGMLSGVSAAQPPGKLVYNLNLIGTGNYGGGSVNSTDYTGGGTDNGSRHTIFLPLKTTYYTDPCDTTGGQNNPYATSIPVQLPQKGVKMNIVPGDSFSVLDGWAGDGDGATLQVPTANGTYDVYAVAKGKPGGCLDLEAYTYLDETLIFLGSVDVDRGKAKPSAVSLSNLLYDGSVALFADPYDGYFWQLYNNGLRLMNIRFYQQ